MRNWKGWSGMNKRKKQRKFDLILVEILVISLFGSCIGVFAQTNLYWPVPGHTNLSQGYHEGKAIDISDGSIAGAKVIAAIGGTVTYVFKCGVQHYGSNNNNSCGCNGFGTGVVIAGDDGRIYQYAHMRAGCIPANIYVGARVNAAQQIGNVGTTGNSSGNHLHFGISKGKYWYESGINPQNESYIYSTEHTHSYVSSITSNPTCTNAGVRTYRCSCGNSYTESIPATGHKYNNTKVEPTLTADGYTLHTCSVCGNSYTDQVVKAPQKKDDGWYYCSSMPKEVTTQDYTIEYNNHFEKVAASSPGAGWTQAGVVKDEWQNSGAQYETQEDLTTSNERVLVRSVYYHFCGPSTGNSSNHSQTSSFVHYDSVDANSVNPTYVGVDEGYNYFYLYWKSSGEKVFCQSGVTCDGSYGSHGKRNCTWYKTNVYQNRVHVVQYKYTKDSGWGNEIAVGGSATTTYRFKAIEKQEDTSGDASKDTTADPKQDVTSGNDSTKNETPANTTTEQPKKNVTSNVTNPQPSTNTTQVSTKKVLSKVKGLKLAAKKYGIVRVNWKKVKGASYYKIQISKKKSFKGAKSYTCNTTKYALWGLKKKKKYYVRVRAYSENDVAGAYCKAKRVKVK